MKQHMPRSGFWTAVGVSLLCVTPDSAMAAKKGESSGGGLSGLFGDFFVKKERSMLQIRGGLSVLREPDSYPDPVLGLELNAAFSRYVNVELGAGGYHEEIPRFLWNDFLSYVVAGVAYTMTSLAGRHDEFHELRDPMVITFNDTAHPYYSTAVLGGAFLVPFPSLRFQPQVGVQLMDLKVRNKESKLRSVDSFKTMPSVGIERRGDGYSSGVRMLFGPKTEGTVIQGIKGYFGVDL